MKKLLSITLTLLALVACTVENTVEPSTATVINNNEPMEFPVKRVINGDISYWHDKGTDTNLNKFYDSVRVRQVDVNYRFRVLRDGIWQDKGVAGSWQF